MEREYYATSVHKGHTKHAYLDDYDFDWLVEDLTEYLLENRFSKEDFEYDDHSDVTEIIEEAVKEIVCEKARDDFGWKYGFDIFIIPSIAEDLYDVIKTKFMED